MEIDVEVESMAGGALRGRLGKVPGFGGSLDVRRRRLGFALSVLLPLAVTLLLIPLKGSLNLSSDVLVFLLVVVVVARVGGFAPALVAALGGSLLLNFFFTPPVHTFTIQEANNALSLFVFVAAALLVSSVVDLAARRTRQATRAAAESQILADLATTAAGGTPALPSVLAHVTDTFAIRSVSVLHRTSTDESSTWTMVASSGATPPDHPERADRVVPVGTDHLLAISGDLGAPEDQRLLTAFAAQLAGVLERLRLAEEAAAAIPLAAANKMRTSLLAAVGHDLRTPLATAKAVVSSLLGRDVDWAPEDRDELLATADQALDRLASLVDNLLDMSRLQAGALAVLTTPTSVDEVVARALSEVGAAGREVVVDLPGELPDLLADPGLLERVLANLVDNALRYSPPDQPPTITASASDGHVEIRVVDRGRGIPTDDLDRVFAPFQRLGDTDNTVGIGLGLALARGLAEAMGGTLTPDRTPGGGATMVVSLEAAPPGTQPGDGVVGRRERQADPERSAR